MKIFYLKYLKYKQKYIKLKQVGGDLCDFNDWEEIINNGHQNCGIFIHKRDSSLIMKCGSKMNKNVNIINSQASIFPKEYSECTDKKGRKYLIMERFDNDITHIYFNLLPIKVLKAMNLDKQTILDIKMLFDIKTRTSNKPIIPIEHHQNILVKVSNNNEITLELYDKFINNLIIEWNIYHPIIIKEIIKVLLKLIELKYNYNDIKFDNFAYKLSDTIIKTDYRQENVPKIFNKYFYVYILDPDSGLSPILKPYNTLDYSFKFDTDEIKDKINYHDFEFNKFKNIYINNIITTYNNGFNLNVHGFVRLTDINKKINISTYNTEIINILNPEIINILNTQYEYNLKKYKYNKIEEIIDNII